MEKRGIKFKKGKIKREFREKRRGKDCKEEESSIRGKEKENKKGEGRIEKRGRKFNKGKRNRESGKKAEGRIEKRGREFNKGKIKREGTEKNVKRRGKDCKEEGQKFDMALVNVVNDTTAHVGNHFRLRWKIRRFCRQWR